MSSEIIERILEIEKQAKNLISQAHLDADKLRAEQTQQILDQHNSLKAETARLKAIALTETNQINAQNQEKLNSEITQLIDKIDLQASANIQLAKKIGINYLFEGH